MDWIIWLIVIVVIVAAIWWLLNRNSRGGAGSGAADTRKTAAPLASTSGPETPARSGTGTFAAPAAGTAATPAAEAPTAPAVPVQEQAAPAAAAPAAGAAPAAEPRAAEGAEWETQWSETPTPEPHAAGAHEPARAEHTAAHGAHVAQPGPAEGTLAGATAVEGLPVHHPEYTEPHAPTLPGAESAAAESSETADVEGATTAPAAPAPAAPHTAVPHPDADIPPAVAAEVPGLPPAEAETVHTAASVAASETPAGHRAEPSGHLALDQPYGEGSAAPAADGSGPEGFTVKGNASSMIYHDETSPSYEETRAEVWFLSPAHAEAAGFRPPRRTRQ